MGKRCDDLLRQTCAEPGWTSLALAVQPDHLPRVVRVFVRVWPSVRAAAAVKACKGCSAFMLRTACPAPQRLLSLWTRSYFASTAGNVGSDIIQRSIEAQSRQSFDWEPTVGDESLRKAYAYTLQPTPEQEQALAEVLWRCRVLSNTALEPRITADRRCGVPLTC
jgi:putative transposase